MFEFFCMLILFICAVLIVVVLIQNPKGGGLGAGLNNNANLLGGVQRSTDILEKTTWGFGIALFAFCIIANAFLDTKKGVNDQGTPTKIEDIINK